MSWLEQPQVVAIEVAKRAAVLSELALLKVKLLELCAFLVVLFLAADRFVKS